MENIIRNIKDGQGDGSCVGIEYAIKIANEHQNQSGNRCVVRRVIDNIDTYNGEKREHFSFDVIEIIE